MALYVPPSGDAVNLALLPYTGSVGNAVNLDIQPGTVYSQTFNDIVTVTDLGITKQITKGLSEVVTVSDTISITKTKVKIFTDDVLTVTDSMIKTLTKVFTDTITVSDHLIKFLNGLSTVWTKLAKLTGSWNTEPKSTGNWTTGSKSTGTWTEEEKGE